MRHPPGHKKNRQNPFSLNTVWRIYIWQRPINNSISVIGSKKFATQG
jgi:hypothetical protein